MSGTTSGGRRALTPQERQDAGTVASGLMKRWGVSFTQDDVNQVLNDVRVSSDIDIRRGVKDQMFSLLIRRDPVRAIELRINYYEKEGMRIAGGLKEKIIETARTGGWKPANEMLLVAVESGGGASGQRDAGAAGQDAAPRLRKLDEALGISGLNLQEMLELAEGINHEMMGVYERYKDQTEKIREKHNIGWLSDAAQKEFGAEMKTLGLETVETLNALKLKRDLIFQRAVATGIMEVESVTNGTPEHNAFYNVVFNVCHVASNPNPVIRGSAEMSEISSFDIRNLNMVENICGNFSKYAKSIELLRKLVDESMKVAVAAALPETEVRG